MQRLVDSALAVTKESVKTVTYEWLNGVVRVISGLSAILLTILPGKSNILESLQGWELRPSLRGPGFPRWMETGVSSFNKFIHDLSVDSDASTEGYTSAEEDDDRSYATSPRSSHGSQVSHSSNFAKDGDHLAGCIMFLFSWMLLPIKLLLWIPYYFWRFFRRGSRPSSGMNSVNKAHTHKYHIIHRPTDRRRGVVEDIHFAMEIFIEAIFDFFHRAAHLLLSPSEVVGVVSKWLSSDSCSNEDIQVGISETKSDAVPVDSVGENQPPPTERKTTFHPLNTDARTCQDVITEQGYPYEAIRVITSDGYVLVLERIPRRDSRKAVYFQHGMFDSSLCWVSNGVVGSPAFAAYDQGFDVYLGNFRGLVSREHIDKKISLRKYWQYSLNEHGTEDIPAMIEKIHEVKTAELKLSHPDLDEESNDGQLYKLCGISHSMGGAAMPMYVITRHIEGKPHRLSRMILLSPAGFHHDSILFFSLLECLFIWFTPIVAPLVPCFYIPTRFFRMLLNKLARDFQNYPAVGGLVQTLLSSLLGGDGSNWVGALGLPHYNMNDMPGVSVYVMHHLAQMKYTKKFRMYDYGSASANMEAYRSPEPLDLGENYGLIDIPVDLVAGRKDNVIRASMVREHYKTMKNAGVDVSYMEFEYGHVDFVYYHREDREEVLAYVMSRLLLVDLDQKQQPNLKASKSKRNGQEKCE